MVLIREALTSTSTPDTVGSGSMSLSLPSASLSVGGRIDSPDGWPSPPPNPVEADTPD